MNVPREWFDEKIMSLIIKNKYAVHAVLFAMIRVNYYYKKKKKKIKRRENFEF